jgi:hypothetical protein
MNPRTFPGPWQVDTTARGHFVIKDAISIVMPRKIVVLGKETNGGSTSWLLISTVRLFALFGMPRYQVIVCYDPR